MKTQVEFQSKAFPACENEDDEINPKRYGKRLAEYISSELKKLNIQTSEPEAEDWGWRLDLNIEEFNSWLGVGNYEEYENGFLVFIEPHSPIIRRFIFKKISTEEFVNKIQKALDKILSSNKDISNIKWSTYEEFNQIKS